MSQSQYVLVTPARDEEIFIGKTIEAVTRQTLRPRNWVIVDDGSSDQTVAIVSKAAATHRWITLIRRPDRGGRDVGKGSVEAFNCGFRALQNTNYDYICNLDADIVIGPYYYEMMLAVFRADPTLGMAVGSLFETYNGVRTRLRCQPEMVAGGATCWRRACFESINGLVEHTAWDGIDCYKAMMHGWQTRTLTDCALDVDHLRPLCTSYSNVLRGWAQRGRGMWFFGADPIWVCASSMFHTMSRPFVFAGGALLFGFIKECFTGGPQIDDPELLRFVRQWQSGKLKRKVSTLFSRSLNI